MASDQQVSARIILRTLTEAKRIGAMRMLEDLEKVEPDLAEYVLESLSALHQRLFAIGANHRRTRRLYREIQQLVVVSIAALRTAHFELWKASNADSALASLDPDLNAESGTTGDEST